MAEIEKLYKLAGLQYCQKCRHDSEIDCIYLCENKHPEFTAEKQIQLLQELTKESLRLEISYDYEDIPTWNVEGVVRGESQRTFEEALASYINVHWKLYSDRGRQVIRDILK